MIDQRNDTRSRPNSSAGSASLVGALRQLRQMGETLPPGVGDDWQAALDRLAGTLRNLIDVIPDGHLVTDRQGLILEGNQAAAELLGTRRDFLIGKPFPFYLGPEHSRSVYAYLADVPREPDRLRDWVIRLRSPRSKAPVVVTLTATVLWADGSPPEVRWHLRDTSRVNALDQALRAEKEFAAGMMEAAQTAVLLLDADGRILRWNAYVQTVTGHDGGSLRMRDWTRLQCPTDREGAREAFQRVLRSREARRFPGSLLSLAGPPRVMAWSLKPLPSTAGADLAVLVLGHDMTDLKRAQEQALQAERLAAIGQVAAVLAHESGNLLQASQACLERLSWRVHDQPESLDLIERVKAAQFGLRRLFDDARGYAAPMRLDAVHCDLVEIWRSAWRQARAGAPGRDAVLEELLETEDFGIVADPFRLGQVFRNLFENAMTASADPVKVEVHGQATVTNGRSGLRVVVRDHGPGLNDEQRRRIFEPFFTTRTRGTGLGMAIAQRILHAHGGEIVLLDNANPGARLCLLLPKNPP